MLDRSSVPEAIISDRLYVSNMFQQRCLVETGVYNVKFAKLNALYLQNGLRTTVLIDGWNALNLYKEHIISYLPSKNAALVREFFHQGFGSINYLFPRLCRLLRRWFPIEHTDIEIVIKDYKMQYDAVPITTSQRAQPHMHTHFMIAQIQHICKNYGISCHVLLTHFETYFHSLTKAGLSRVQAIINVRAYTDPIAMQRQFYETALEQKCFGFAKYYLDKVYDTEMEISETDHISRRGHASKGCDDALLLLIALRKWEKSGNALTALDIAVDDILPNDSPLKQNFSSKKKNIILVTNDRFRDLAEFRQQVDNCIHCHIDQDGEELREKINMEKLMIVHNERNINIAINDMPIMRLDFASLYIDITMLNVCPTALCLERCVCLDDFASF
jgi:hypothetical protein